MELERSLVMGRRLKMLRESKGLSHIKLSEALLEKYGVSVKKDSLMSFEVSEIPHNRAGANAKMKVEYLDCLAKFYGVSTEYILGNTDIKSPDLEVNAICEYTGLSEDVVKFLHTSADISRYYEEKRLNGRYCDISKGIRDDYKKAKCDLRNLLDHDSGIVVHNDRYLDLLSQNFMLYLEHAVLAYWKDPEIARYYKILLQRIHQSNETDFDTNEPNVHIAFGSDDVLPILRLGIAERLSRYL